MLPAEMALLKHYPQFILWGLRDKVKIPLSHRTKYPCSIHDESNWLGYQDAVNLAAQEGFGVAFVLTRKTGLICIDLDDCLSEGGLTPEATAHLQTFRLFAHEISYSGTGLHIWGQASDLPEEHRCRVKGYEVYTQNHYIALTGKLYPGSGHLQNDTQGLFKSFLQLAPPKVSSVNWSEVADPGWDGPLDDGMLLQKALASQSAASLVGGRASFKQLWEADPEILGQFFPDSRSRAFDHSAADAALCSHLAFWTGKNCARIERIFNQSALCRDKWTSRAKYREDTILNAVSRCTAVYNSRPAAASSQELGWFLNPLDQIEYFKGCIYVRDKHRVFVPDGALLRPDPFKAIYGGKIFALDAEGAKATKNAFEALTENRVNPTRWVHGTCFRPECPPGGILEDPGQMLVNTYIPIKVPSRPGDISPFADLLCKMLPLPHDRDVLLAWMAALVQYPGVKFQWAPLIQGVEGNGKSAILKICVEALGWRYAHLPNANDLGNKFNDWLQNKLFIGIEEIWVAQKWELMEELKAYITNERIEIQGKGSNQFTGDNRANFMMCSNHRDAVVKGRSDRRYCVFFTKHQTLEDLVADGMRNTMYFPNFYNWLKARGGYAFMTNYLQKYVIPPELNPATLAHTAPETSSTAEAIVISLGSIEQEILAAIEEERPGFRCDMVGSVALDNLIKAARVRPIPRNKRLPIMRNVGYDLHPALRGGKATRAVLSDGGVRPTIYVRKGSEYCRDTLTGGQVTELYVQAQSLSTPG